ncbi:hypothetical protein OESDEN_07655 [Oesophagostomum dentatum]|uniref:Uncharacterized protein n=1 Tax=Oesophagostomum dentatum TaxID=61180 RepID=A0A0B1T8G8_OESDE|nr:hypothetical protein OESDEN_07655 [Oesophagostomum dentatum]
MIVTMRSRQSKSRSPSRSRSSQSTDSRMQTASLGSSLHSDYSASSSKKAPSDSGQRLGGTDVGKACSRLLRENPPSTRPQKDLETVETGHMRRMSMPTAVRSTATESSIREANSTTVLSSAPSSRLGLCSSRRQSASSATTSGSRFGRRIRPGDGYPTSTGTSSRSGMESRRSFHLPASRFGLPPPPQGWEERQRQNDSLSVEPEVVEKSLQKSEKSATTVINANAVAEKKISKDVDATLKTARPLKSKKLRKPRPQDTRPSYYGLHGRIKRISRKSKRKAINHLATTTVHPEEAPTQQISPDAFSARRIHDQASPRLKTAIESLEKSNTQTGLEVHVECKMNSSGRMNISGTTPEGLTPKRVTVNGKNIWAGS